MEIMIASRYINTVKQ